MTFDAMKTLPCRIATDPEIFFPVSANETAAIQAAKDVCDVCPVQRRCGEYAFETRQPYGTWGGVTEWERRDILKRRSKTCV